MTSSTEQIGTINVTPLIDILLVLLIIFMVITPLSSHGLTAALPKDSLAAPAQPELNEIVLEMTRDHQFLINKEFVPRRDLAAQIATLYSVRANQHLFIQADGDLDYREVAAVMDDMRGANQSLQFALMAKK